MLLMLIFGKDLDWQMSTLNLNKMMDFYMLHTANLIPLDEQFNFKKTTNEYIL